MNVTDWIVLLVGAYALATALVWCTVMFLLGPKGRKVIDAFLAERRAEVSYIRYNIILMIVIVLWPLLFTKITNPRK